MKKRKTRKTGIRLILSALLVSAYAAEKAPVISECHGIQIKIPIQYG